MNAPPPKKNREKIGSGRAVARSAKAPEKNFEKVVPRGVDRERVRRAMENGYFFGLDGEWFAARIWAWLDEEQEPRLVRRDAAIVALAALYAGKPHAVAKSVDAAILEYGASVWRRRDYRLDSAPLEYRGNRKELLFSILRENGGEKNMPRDRQIRRICARPCKKTEKLGHFSAFPLAKVGAHPPIRANQTEARAPMNALTPHSDKKILDALRASPEVKKFVADEAARDQAARQKIVDAIAALDANAERDFPALEKAVQIAIAGVREAAKALEAANGRLNVANYAKSGANLAYTGSRQSLEAQLRAGANAELFDNFQREMRDEIEKTRAKHVGGFVQSTNPVARKTELHGFTNAPSVNARLAAINAAREEAERLRISADQSKVAALLDKLRTGLPEVGAPIGPGVGVKAGA